MKLLIPFLGSILLVSCSGNGELKSLDIDEKSIDQYVEEKLDTSQTYDILTGMRFSKGENYAYSAVRFSQNDTAILYTELIEDSTGTIYRNLFYKDKLPVYVEEDIIVSDGITTTYKQRKIYLNGAIILKAYERSASDKDTLAEKEFTEITMTMNQFDFERAEKSVTQLGDYEMSFGEFLILDLMSYLVLENKESGYSVALYLIEGDDLINTLYANPDAYQGKVIRCYHQFMYISGIQQMVYTGGEIIE